MEAKKKKREGKRSRGVSAGIIIACCFVLAFSIYTWILGAPENFVNNDPNNHPLPGNMLGTVYKGGFNVVIVITLLLTVLALSVERAFAISKARGKGNLINFVYDVKEQLEKGDMKAADALCSKQKGSVAAVVAAGLKKYEDMEKSTDTELSKEQ